MRSVSKVYFVFMLLLFFTSLTATSVLGAYSVDSDCINQLSYEAMVYDSYLVKYNYFDKSTLINEDMCDINYPFSFDLLNFFVKPSEVDLTGLSGAYEFDSFVAGFSSNDTLETYDNDYDLMKSFDTKAFNSELKEAALNGIEFKNNVNLGNTLKHRIIYSRQINHYKKFYDELCTNKYSLYLNRKDYDPDLMPYIERFKRVSESYCDYYLTLDFESDDNKILSYEDTINLVFNNYKLFNLDSYFFYDFNELLHNMKSPSYVDENGGFVFGIPAYDTNYDQFFYLSYFDNVWKAFDETKFKNFSIPFKRNLDVSEQSFDKAVLLNDNFYSKANITALSIDDLKKFENFILVKDSVNLVQILYEREIVDDIDYEIPLSRNDFYSSLDFTPLIYFEDGKAYSAPKPYTYFGEFYDETSSYFEDTRHDFFQSLVGVYKINFEAQRNDLLRLMLSFKSRDEGKKLFAYIYDPQNKRLFKENLEFDYETFDGDVHKFEAHLLSNTDYVVFISKKDIPVKTKFTDVEISFGSAYTYKSYLQNLYSAFFDYIPVKPSAFVDLDALDKENSALSKGFTWVGFIRFISYITLFLVIGYFIYNIYKTYSKRISFSFTFKPKKDGGKEKVIIEPTQNTVKIDNSDASSEDKSDLEGNLNEFNLDSASIPEFKKEMYEIERDYEKSKNNVRDFEALFDKLRKKLKEIESIKVEESKDKSFLISAKVTEIEKLIDKYKKENPEELEKEFRTPFHKMISSKKNSSSNDEFENKKSKKNKLEEKKVHKSNKNTTNQEDLGNSKSSQEKK